MIKSSFILLNILLATSAVFAYGGLVFIGQFGENNYYISLSAATWSNAYADCQKQLRGNGHLVSIETEAEWDFLTLALENSAFGRTYWTSGMYDPTRSVWRWTKNDEALLAFAPWAPGFPSTPSQLLRVAFYITNGGHWVTIHSTQLHNYICEVKLEH